MKQNSDGWYVYLIDMSRSGTDDERFEYTMPWRPEVGEQVRAEEWMRTDGVYWVVDEIESSPDPEPDVLYLMMVVEA